MARLKLPPTHNNFPHTALLHAICAVTARYTAAVHTISVEEAVRRTNEEIRGNLPRRQGTSAEDEAASQECFGDRHGRFALLEMHIGQVTGRRMLEIAQAQAVLCIYYQQHGKWHCLEWRLISPQQSGLKDGCWQDRSADSLSLLVFFQTRRVLQGPETPSSMGQRMIAIEKNDVFSWDIF